MLKQRIITALVIAAIALVLIFAAPQWLFALAMLAMMLVGAWEWAAFAGIVTAGGRAALVVLFAFVALSGSALLQQGWGSERTLVLYCALALMWWVLSFVWLATWRGALGRPVKILCGLLTLVPSLTAVVAIHAAGAWYLVMLLLITSAADIGAFFAGRAFGRHKLAPAVSPGKTWEGVVGGVILVAAVAAVGSHWLPLKGGLFVILCIGVALLSVIGDLSESLFKRQAGLKDSGSLFPGHGGVLDRVDSLTAAAPLYWLGMYLLGVFQ